MNRTFRALLLLAGLSALAVAAFLALDRDGAQANPEPVITVNSTADTNARDSVMTLREAMLLATGDLPHTGLTQGECGQISTAFYNLILGCLSLDPPGSASADRIVFDPGVFPSGSPATISLGTVLPFLDTNNDTVDGSAAGVIVNGINRTHACFEIKSNSNTIKGLEIYNCNSAVWITEGAQNNTIGGSSPTERNVISSNDIGVLIVESGTANNTVRGNYIGTNADGTTAMPNNIGVYIFPFVSLGGAQNNVIGGTANGDGNLISGNHIGVKVSESGTNGNVIRGNYIGTNAAGESGVPNDIGVLIMDGAQNNTVGGPAAGEGNTIAFNQEGGVRVEGPNTTGNAIRGNSIHSNGGKGIETIGGGNGELAPPVITGLGPVTGTGCPNCTIDLYSDNEDEGRVYEGSTTADGAGNWTFDGSPEGPNVTATATDAAGNTSEFSAPVDVNEPTPTPTPTPTPPPSATPTPSAGSTRTLQWGPGWHNEIWPGPGGTPPQDAFGCADGSYAAAYRFTDAGLQRFFPDRPDISNMAPLAQYDAFLVLITQPVACTMPVAAAPGVERTLAWGLGWHNEGWTGADAMPPSQNFACADGNYAAVYRFTDAGLERFFPGRPDISNMGPLNKYDAFLILSTAPVSCEMVIAP